MNRLTTRTSLFASFSYPTFSFLMAGLILLAGCQSSADTSDFATELDHNQVLADADVLPSQNSGMLPDFVLPNLDGGTFDSSDHRGRVLLINFWATWCAPCRVEMPDLVALQEELGSDDFAVLGISLDTDGPDYVKEFADLMEVNYPMLLDDGEVAEAFGGVYALPTTFVVDKKGAITHRTIGLFPIDTVKEELVKMIDAE